MTVVVINGPCSRLPSLPLPLLLYKAELEPLRLSLPTPDQASHPLTFAHAPSQFEIPAATPLPAARAPRRWNTPDAGPSRRRTSPVFFTGAPPPSISTTTASPSPFSSPKASLCDIVPISVEQPIKVDQEQLFGKEESQFLGKQEENNGEEYFSDYGEF
ncbi:uncharacterized protein LOC120682628 [Panicum virgatum]|uniref:uncharacterized protein LOC120682628 n=1 Tax=Panicum virgatum TaxID=38727 RepID=UPI0019D65CF5|nr:uncharacterized protein LOC120682628 [Panicum virgatum]